MIKMIVGFFLVGIGLLPVAYAAESAPPNVAPTAAIKTININTASAKEMSAILPGIGPNKAVALVVYRKRFGGFKSINEVAKVDGISPSTLKNLMPYMRISDSTPAPATIAMPVSKPAVGHTVKKS